MMRLLCGQRDYHKDVLSLCDLHPTLVGIVLLCFCLAQAAFAQSRAHGKEYKKKLLRADVLLFIAIFMYVGMTENFANKNEDVDIPSIYSTGNIVCDLKKGNLILLMGGHTNEIKVSTQRNQNRWIQPTRNQD